MNIYIILCCFYFSEESSGPAQPITELPIVSLQLFLSPSFGYIFCQDFVIWCNFPYLEISYFGFSYFFVYTVVDLGGHPPMPQNFLNFMQFFTKIWQNNILASPWRVGAPSLWGILDPPLVYIDMLVMLQTILLQYQGWLVFLPL